MRIGLYSGSTLYPLAGASGVSERTHSSAGDFALTPESAVQVAAFVRGTYAKPIDRGNLLNAVAFTTARQFATPAAAQLWCLDYHATFPTSGTLYFDAIAPGGGITRRTMADTVVDPPRRRVVGATVLLDYNVKGGVIAAGTPPAAATGSITVTGAPVHGNSITVAGQVFTWKTSPSGLYEILVNSPSFTSSEATAIRNAINAAGLAVTATSSGAVATFTAINPGTAGNALSLAASGPFTTSGATLTGGTD
jgi:hypothetical protein